MAFALRDTEPDRSGLRRSRGAAVSICGIPDLVAFLERTSGYRRSFREAEYGSLGRDRALLERLSPRAHAHRIQCPVMLVHGENDARVACAESRELHALLRGRGQACELLALPGEGHGIEERASKVAMYRQIAGFLARAGGVAQERSDRPGISRRRAE